MKMLMKRDVEKAHAEIDLLKVAQQHVYVPVPVFAHSEELSARIGAHIRQPRLVERGADVLDRVQPEAVQLRGVDVPMSPAA